MWDRVRDELWPRLAGVLAALVTVAAALAWRGEAPACVLELLAAVAGALWLSSDD